MASATRTAIPDSDRCPGEYSNRPAPVRRYPVSKREMTMANSEKARMSSLARAMNAKTSSSDSTVVP